jgi:hypothetical protein
VILLVLAVFSAVVDPYAAFRTRRIEGVNKYKPMALPFIRLVKPYHVNWLNYDVLVTGSSRAGRGIDCRYFQSRGERCYNAGVTGGGVYEAYRFLQQRTQLDRAIVFLDFFVFLREGKATESFEEERLLISSGGQLNTAYPQQAANDIFGLLFSLQTLKAARNTKRWQDKSFTNPQADGMMYFDDWGRWGFDPGTLDHARPNLRVNRQVKRYGHILETMEAYYQEHAEDMDKSRENLQRHLEVYRQLLEFVYRQGMDASLVLSPSHISYWMLLHQSGFHDLFKYWIRNLVRINEEVAASYSRTALPLFDFSGANTVAVSGPPRRDDPQSFSKQFTDVMHFSRAVGDRMLDRILGGCQNKVTDGAFGSCLSSGNIDLQFQRQDLLFRRHQEGTRAYLQDILSVARHEPSAQ